MKQECNFHAKNEEKLKEELGKESEFRQKVESEWNERAEQHKTEVEKLNSQIKEAENIFKQFKLSYETLYHSTQKDLKMLSNEREKIVRELKRLQDENDNLVGKYSSKGKYAGTTLLRGSNIIIGDLYLISFKYCVCGQTSFIFNLSIFLFYAF